MKKINNLILLLSYSYKILYRNLAKFSLPFLSLTFTTLIILTVILFTNSSQEFLLSKNKELIGGDISIESSYRLEEHKLAKVFDGSISIKASSEIMQFPGILTSGLGSTAVSIQSVDVAYPLQGNIALSEGDYIYLAQDEIYLDQNAVDKLKIKTGEIAVYNNIEYKLKGIIKRDASQLVGGVGFLPKMLISKEGMQRSSIDMSLLRAEYKYLYNIEGINKNEKQNLLDKTKDLGAQVSIARLTKTNFLQGLNLVEQFLILIVLLVCVLSAVDIFSGILYLLNLLKKSFAVLLALGLSRARLAGVLSLCLFYILAGSFVLGSVIAVFLFSIILSFINNNFELLLPQVSLIYPLLVTLFIVFAVSFAAFIPNLISLMQINPKDLISQNNEIESKNIFRDITLVTLFTLAPIMLVAIYLLESFWYGFISIVVIAALYITLSIVFYLLLRLAYRFRHKFGFTLRIVIAQKYKDGLFGIVSLTSLYIALASVSVLILLQATLSSFLRGDLQATLPGLYVIDVQKSQVENIKQNSSDINLFPNVGARIMRIDDKNIQESLAKGDESVARELGREYNLTYRKDLLVSEKVLQGKWLSGITNEVSVEESFAERADIRLGSKIVFILQGFELEATVTSLRQSDSRSGLPFFFFVFNVNDLEKYPATFFGYTNLNEKEQAIFVNFLAQNMPNVSVIDTKEVGKFAEGIIAGLLLLVAIISFPPLTLALFLIVTLIISSFDSRRKQSAQLEALGAKKSFIEKLYYLETIFITLCGSTLAYITGMIATIFIALYYLDIKSFKLFDIELIIALSVILILIIAIAFVTWRRDKRPIRELLSYEEI
jgi:putative ABC transport system permease protein